MIGQLLRWRRRRWFRCELIRARLRRWHEQQAMQAGEKVGRRHVVVYTTNSGQPFLLAEFNGKRYKRVDEFAVRWVAVDVGLQREHDQAVVQRLIARAPLHWKTMK